MISFSSKDGKNGYLSNSYPAAMDIDGFSWKSVDHYFQTMKFVDPAVRQLVRMDNNYHIYGRDIKNSSLLHPTWDTMKFDVMRKAVYEKFRQNPTLQGFLLSCGSDSFENAIQSDEWGLFSADGYSGGKNMLGIIIGEVKRKLEAEQKPAASNDNYDDEEYEDDDDEEYEDEEEECDEALADMYDSIVDDTVGNAVSNVLKEGNRYFYCPGADFKTNDDNDGLLVGDHFRLFGYGNDVFLKVGDKKYYHLKDKVLLEKTIKVLQPNVTVVDAYTIIREL